MNYIKREKWYNPYDFFNKNVVKLLDYMILKNGKNIALNICSNQTKNEKYCNGSSISKKCIDLLNEYINNFPFIIEQIEKSDIKYLREIPIETLFYDPVVDDLNAIKENNLEYALEKKLFEWIKIKRPPKSELIPIDCSRLTKDEIKELLTRKEKSRMFNFHFNSIKYPALHSKYLDSKKNHLYLAKKVVIVLRNGSFPFGKAGIVIATSQTHVEVLLDEEYEFGTTLHGSCPLLRGCTIQNGAVELLLPHHKWST